MTCTVLAWAAVLILLPVLFLTWLTESRQQRCRRLRRAGWTQQKIADHLHISRTTVRRELALQ
jgi:AraC-like DNA-binding protein